SLALPALADGQHTVVVTARDRDGNGAPSAPRSFGIDATPPIPPAPKTPAPGAVLRASALAFTTAPATDAISAVASSSLTVDGKPATLDAFGHLLGTKLADGAHSWSTGAVDAAGNAAASPAVPFTLDDVAPRVTILASHRVRVAGRGVRVKLRASEPGRATITLSATKKPARRLHLRLRKGVAVLGRVEVALSGAAQTVTLRVKKATLRRLRHARGLRLRVTVTVADGAGNHRSVVLAGRS
ncbi:MAG: hypothetical protein JWQ18_2097, partial [Conexibacter sp.]|nr:hypothetical protein [Conexibacter sp.]